MRREFSWGAWVIEVARVLIERTLAEELAWRFVGRGKRYGYACMAYVDGSRVRVTIRSVSSRGDLQLRAGATFFMGDKSGKNPLGKLWLAIRKSSRHVKGE